MMKSAVIIRSTKNRSLDDVISEIMEFCEWKTIIDANSKVIIKPNLCTEIKEKIPCANTDKNVIESVCKVLKMVTSHIVIGESDGTRYKAEDAFQNTGIYEIARKYNISILNFSHDRKREINHPHLRGFPLPATLLDADVVINLPVLKTHALTLFSGAIKNLWGCIPQYNRILLHQYLNDLLPDLIGIIKPKISIMDGILAMEGRGPVNGIPRQLDLLLGSRDLVALDATAMRLVGLNPKDSKHIVLSHKRGYGNIEEDKIEIDGDFEGTQVKFLPAVNDWAIRGMNYMTRYKLFTEKILLNDAIFYPIRSIVQTLRKIKGET